MTWRLVRYILGAVVSILTVLAFIWAAGSVIGSHVSDEEHERELSEAIDDIPQSLSKEQFDTFWRQYRLDVGRGMGDLGRLEDRFNELQKEMHQDHD